MQRSRPTKTQTTKDRLARLQNMDKAFRIRRSSSLAGKHILLVDDVMTTGATLTACAESLGNSEDLRVSIATIAIAE